MKKSNIAILLGFLLIALSFSLLSGCADMKGTINENVPPNVDFVTVPKDSSSFNFAPIIYWAGNDPDGFVEYYSFADITDSAAIQDPLGYYNQIPDEVWTDTIATQARVYLLTETGDEQRHIFYVRCVDNEGAISAPKYRTFNRTNQPPRTPTIGLVGMSDDEMSSSVYVADTLFSGSEVTETWGGISFTWLGSDPDDRSLYKIPIQFKPVLVKAPGDTIFSMPWSDELGITLSGLETGFYTLYVWARDDGFTLSTAPARIEFNVINPTFEHRLLMWIEGNAEGQAVTRRPSNDSLSAFYRNVLLDVLGQGAITDTVNVRVFMSDNSTDPLKSISSALIQQYRMVIIASDQFRRVSLNDDYMNNRNNILASYMQVGGRVWYMGRMLKLQTIGSNTQEGNRLLEDYFFADSLSGRTNWLGNGLRPLADFIGTQSAVPEMHDLTFTDFRAGENWLNPLYVDMNYGLSGAEIIARKAGAETTQYYISLTDTLQASATDVDCAVVDTDTLWANTAREYIFYYPATPINCYLRAPNRNLFPDGVTRIINQTLLDEGFNNYEGEPVVVNNNIIYVSYEEGRPWQDSDILEVDYRYDPLTEWHLKPVEIRMERVEISQLTFSQLRFRSALTTFSYYFMDYDDVVENWRLMMEWFESPNIHFSR